MAAHDTWQLMTVQLTTVGRHADITHAERSTANITTHN